MSIVVEILECRICPCTSFGLAPASIIHVAQEVRSERQVAFFGLMPSFSAAGLRCRRRILPSRIGPPLRTDWNTSDCGSSERTSLIFFFAPLPPQFNSTESVFRRLMRAITDRSTPMVAALHFGGDPCQSESKRHSTRKNCSASPRNILPKLPQPTADRLSSRSRTDTPSSTTKRSRSLPQSASHFLLTLFQPLHGNFG
jgi:hypothetical protein